MLGQGKFVNQRIQVAFVFDANTGLLRIEPIFEFVNEKLLYDMQNPFLLNIKKIKDTDTTELFNMIDKMAENKASELGKSFLK